MPLYLVRLRGKAGRIGGNRRTATYNRPKPRKRLERLLGIETSRIRRKEKLWGMEEALGEDSTLQAPTKRKKREEDDRIGALKIFKIGWGPDIH